MRSRNRRRDFEMAKQIAKQLKEPRKIKGGATRAKKETRDRDVIGVPEAAKLLHLGRNGVYNGCARGEIPHTRIGKHLRFSRDGLTDWLKSTAARMKAEMKAEYDFSGAERGRFAKKFPTLEGRGVQHKHPRIVNVSFDVTQEVAAALRALRDTGLFGYAPDCASVAEELLRRALRDPEIARYWQAVPLPKSLRNKSRRSR